MILVIWHKNSLKRPSRMMYWISVGNVNRKCDLSVLSEHPSVLLLCFRTLINFGFGYCTSRSMMSSYICEIEVPRDVRDYVTAHMFAGGSEEGFPTIRLPRQSFSRGFNDPSKHRHKTILFTTISTDRTPCIPQSDRTNNHKMIDRSHANATILKTRLNQVNDQMRIAGIEALSVTI